MFAGAAFTDQADINADNADAVELLTTLNIISGYPDGTFDPEGTVDRAEMAKMIYTIRNGGNDDASAHVDNTTSFTDINGHWAEGYIKYLQNTGIVAGKSATTFDPDSPVTTTEAMKMALALAGYDEKNAELTGPNWSKNTLTLATTIGLTDNVSSAMTAGCTRQDAAQILANVLEATAVRYSAIVENFVNDSKTGLSYGGDPITVGYKWMDLTIYVGQMVSSGELAIENEDDEINAAGVDRFTVDVETVNGVEWNRWDWINNDRPADGMLTVKDGQDHTDLVGQEVKLLTGDKIDEVFGVYATGTSQVVEATMDQIDVEDDFDLSIGDETYDAKDAKVYVDLDQTDYSIRDIFTNNGEKVADAVKMIDWDDNGDYDTILVNTVSMSRVNYVSSSSVTLSAVGASNMRDRQGDVLPSSEVIDLDDNTVYEDIARDDYAVVTKNDYDDSWVVEEATVVTGTVDGKVDDERRVRVDGEWYTLANNADGKQENDVDLYVIDGSRTDFVNRDEITLYTVGSIAYFAEATRGNDINRSVLMVYDLQSSPDEWDNHNQVKAIFPNGDKRTITLDSVNGNAVDLNATGGVNVDVGALYTYTVNNDDEYIIEDVSATNDAGYDHVVRDVDGIENEDTYGGEVIADDAIVFALIDGDDADVYSGKSIIDAKLDADETRATYGVALQDDDNGFTYTRMMNIELNASLNDNDQYGYLVRDAVWSYNSELGSWVMEYAYWDGEQVAERMELTNSNKENWAVAGAIITFSEDGDYIDDVNNAGASFAALLGYSNGRVSLKNSDGNAKVIADVDADTLTYYVDSNASNEADIGQTGVEGWNFIAKEIREGVRRVNVAYVLDDDNRDVEFMVIDIEGELKIPANSGIDEEVIEGASDVEVLDASDYATPAALIDAIEAAAAENVDRVVVDGAATLAGVFNVPSDVDVIFNDAVTLNGATINGDITVASASVTAASKLNGTMTITGAQTADLANLSSDGTAKIVLKNAASGQTKFYEGTAAAAVAVAAPKAGTYTYTTNINDGSSASTTGWLKAAVLGETGVAADVTTVTATKIDKMLDVYNTVEITDTNATLSGVSIPANKTLVIKDSDATAANVEAVTADEGAKLVLEGGLNTINANKWYFGSSQTPINVGTALPAGAEFTYTNGKWVLSSQIDTINVNGNKVTSQTILDEAFAWADNVTLRAAQNLPGLTHLVVDAGETLTITSTSALNVPITGEGTVVVNANFALSNIAVPTLEVAKTAGLTANNLSTVNTSMVDTIVLRQVVAGYASASSGVSVKFYNGINTLINGDLAMGTYVFNANVLGGDPATPGYVLQF